ncbi:MAG: hypothetical protein GVX78_01390 [Bacteroidetes bacterium]|nr:hypothetical protein [Bacteroidota bacterium]
MIKLRSVDTVYDIDDADYLQYYPKTINYFSRNCHYVFAGSKEIVKDLSQLNSDVFHLTSPIIDLGIKKEKQGPAFTIGWVGGFSWGHKENLYRFIFPAIKSLSMPCILVLIGVTKPKDKCEIQNYFKDAKGLKLEMPMDIDWKDELNLQKRISEFDVGVAALCNNKIERAKSGIKIKQYLNNGIPVLSSDLPENNRFVRHGFNGYLCNTVYDFRTKLINIYNMTEKEYVGISKNARNSITNFNHAHHFETIQAAYRKVHCELSRDGI